MKNSRKKRMLSGLSGVCLCSLCSGILAGELEGVAQLPEITVADSGTDATAANPEHEDVPDRAFSPLDKAVSDVNHDINEGNDKEPSETGGSQPQKNTATGSGTSATTTKPRHEDILDRAFSPLDKAVSDVNRDINRDIDKGDEKKTPDTDR